MYIQSSERIPLKYSGTMPSQTINHNMTYFYEPWELSYRCVAYVFTPFCFQNEAGSNLLLVPCKLTSSDSSVYLAAEIRNFHSFEHRMFNVVDKYWLYKHFYNYLQLHILLLLYFKQSLLTNCTPGQGNLECVPHERYTNPCDIG